MITQRDRESDSLDVFESCLFNWRHFTVYHKLKMEDENNLLMKRALLLHAQRKSKTTDSGSLTFSASTALLIKFPNLHILLFLHCLEGSLTVETCF